MQWAGFKSLRLAKTDFDRALANDLEKLEQYVKETATRVARFVEPEPISNTSSIPVPITTQVIAGAGLTGGGSLSSNVTVNVGAGTGIIVAANTVSVDTSLFITGTGTANTIPKYTGVGATLANSSITDDGVTLELGPAITNTNIYGNAIANGGMTILLGGIVQGPFGVVTTATATYDSSISLFIDDITIQAATAISGPNNGKDITLRAGDGFGGDNGTISLNTGTGLGARFRLNDHSRGSEYEFMNPSSVALGGRFNFNVLTNDRTYTWPDASGTVMLSDLDLIEIAAINNVRGDLMVTDSTPSWVRLPIGAANTVLFSDGSDPAWGLGFTPTWTGIHTFSAQDVHNAGILVNGNVKLNTAGNGYYVKEGANATMGIVTLVAGAWTVNTTKITANSRVFLTVNGVGVLANLGSPYENTATRVAGTSFDIKSSNVLDTSNVSWIIIEPA